MAPAGEWQRLAALLDEDGSVQAAVTAAVDQGDDPWEALLDALDDAGVLAYLQVDDTGMELTDALAQLPAVVRVAADLDEATDTDELPAATVVADEVLSGDGLRVVRLVEDDESWPLVVLPAEVVDEVAVLVASVGHRAVTGG